MVSKWCEHLITHPSAERLPRTVVGTLVLFTFVEVMLKYAVIARLNAAINTYLACRESLRG